MSREETRRVVTVPSSHRITTVVMSDIHHDGTGTVPVRPELTHSTRVHRCVVVVVIVVSSVVVVYSAAGREAGRSPGVFWPHVVGGVRASRPLSHPLIPTERNPSLYPYPRFRPWDRRTRIVLLCCQGAYPLNARENPIPSTHVDWKNRVAQLGAHFVHPVSPRVEGSRVREMLRSGA